MARGTWDDDFTCKYGFCDGASVEDRDFGARKIIVRALNKTPQFKKAKVKAVEFDRPGVHNPCMILLLPANMKLKKWLSSSAEEAKEPEGVEYDEIVAAAYNKI